MIINFKKESIRKNLLWESENHICFFCKKEVKNKSFKYIPKFNIDLMIKRSEIISDYKGLSFIFHPKCIKPILKKEIEETMLTQSEEYKKSELSYRLRNFDYRMSNQIYVMKEIICLSK